MSPAITSIPPTPEGEARPVCAGCFGTMADASLKCGNCRRLVHLRCSELPEYQLVRLAVTQASFLCAKCVITKDLDNDEEKYSEELLKLREIIAKEVTIIEQANLDATDRSENTNLVENSSVTSASSAKNHGSPNNNSQARAAPQSNMPVCKFYLRKSCQHGRKGEGCTYSHPKLCYNYIKRGDQRGGCKKGNQCKYEHPKLCKKALDTRTCSNRKCTLYHVAGTKFNEETEPNANNLRWTSSGSITRQNPVQIPKSREADGDRTVFSRQQPQVAQQGDASESNSWRSSPVKRDFLGLHKF